jgi:hypothetical protein
MNASDRSPAKATLRRDLAIFADTGFLVTLALLLVLFAVTTAILLYASSEYGIPAIRLSAPGGSALV